MEKGSKVKNLRKEIKNVTITSSYLLTNIGIT